MAVGTLIIVQWVFFIVTGNVAEFHVIPLEISLHITAEVMTALLLLISSYLLLKRKKKAIKWNLLAQGMLIYTVINSSGYFAQLSQWSFVVMFIVLFVLTIISVFTLIGNVKSSMKKRKK
jgi:hypothetical protein